MHRWHVHRFLTAAVLLLSSCFLSRSPTDGGEPRDAAVDGWVTGEDAGVGEAGPCTLGPALSLCAPVCDGDCPAGTWCFEATTGVCGPLPDPDGPRPCGRRLQPDGRIRGTYCRNSELCIYRPAHERMSGNCVPSDACQYEELGDYGLECRYSDDSLVIDGPPPPPSTCPTEEPGMLCGSPCPDCPPTLAGLADDTPSCVGLSETRGLGLCAVVDQNCTEDYPLDEASRGFLHPVACLRWLDEAGEPEEVGHFVFVDACIAYKRLYPDQLECRGEGWVVLE